MTQDVLVPAVRRSWATVNIPPAATEFPSRRAVNDLPGNRVTRPSPLPSFGGMSVLLGPYRRRGETTLALNHCMAKDPVGSTEKSPHVDMAVGSPGMAETPPP